MLKNTMSPEEKTMANVQAKHPENLQSTFLITQYKLFISTIVSTNFEKEKLHIHCYHFVFCFTACEINFIPHIKEFQKAQTELLNVRRLFRQWLKLSTTEVCGLVLQSLPRP